MIGVVNLLVPIKAEKGKGGRICPTQNYPVFGKQNSLSPLFLLFSASFLRDNMTTKKEVKEESTTKKHKLGDSEKDQAEDVARRTSNFENSLTKISEQVQEHPECK